MAEERAPAPRSQVHAALAVGFPFAFLQALDAIVRVGIAPGTQAGPAGTLLVVLLAGISRAAAAGVLGRERISGAIPLIREVVVTLACCLVVLDVLSGRPFRGDFNPLHVDMTWPIVLCLTQWLLTLLVLEALRARDLFLSLVAGKTGHALASAAHDAGGEAGLAHQAFARLRSLAVILQAFAILPWVIFQVVVSLTLTSAPAFVITLRAMAHAVAGMMFMAILHAFEDEHANLGAGIARRTTPTARRFGAPLAGVAALFLAAAALAGVRALVPMSVLGRIVDWINSLNTGTMSGGFESAAPPSMEQPQSSSQANPFAVEPRSPGLEEFFRIAGIVIAVAAAAGFLFFIVRPLFRKGLLASARRFHPVRAAARATLAFLLFLAGIPSRFARWLRTPGKGFSSIPRAILASLREAAAPAGAAARAREKLVRAARGRAVREFRRLARWGERGGVVLADAEGPMEYADRLLRRAPAKEAAIREAARVFELCVYAPASEPKNERALARLVDGIVR